MAEPYDRRGSIVNTGKTKWERLWPVIACGAGLFSDGYLNGVRILALKLSFNAKSLFCRLSAPSIPC